MPKIILTDDDGKVYTTEKFVGTFLIDSPEEVSFMYRISNLTLQELDIAVNRVLEGSKEAVLETLKRLKPEGVN